MARTLRFVPEDGGLVEVTCRTIQARFLLRPSPLLNEMIVGALGRAQGLYQVTCHLVVFVSNHMHALLSVDDAEQLARFMDYVNSKIAREVADLVDWPDKVWARRYQSIPISNEEKAQVARLRYGLSHGVKRAWSPRQRMARRQLVRAILEDRRSRASGSRTTGIRSSQRGETFDRLKYATVEVLELTPLPCWAHLSPEEYRQRVAELVDDIESEAAAEQEKRLAAFGRPGRAQATSAHTPQPDEEITGAAIDAGDQGGPKGVLADLCRFRSRIPRGGGEIDAKSGDRTARFPLGSFPPGLPFVKAFANGPP